MSLATVLLVAVGLAMDALAVSVAVSLRLRHVSPRQFFRLSFHFGLFQFMMPIIGWAAGLGLAGWIRRIDHWLAFCLLALIGLKMIRDSNRAERPQEASDPTRGKSLILLSVATSIDALAVGVSLSLLRVSIWQPSLVIGIVAALFTLGGMYFGSRLGRRITGGLEIAGGLILIGIGVKILAEHLGG